MPIERINGVGIRFEDSGTGDVPLVLVHGSWGSHHNWDAVAPALSRSFRVVTYDRRGHSESERPPGQGSIHEDVADLAALIEHFDIAPAWVLGSSFGAIITLRLATTRPELLRGIVIHEPPLLRLLEGNREFKDLITENQRRIAAVVERIEAGDHAGGAELFAESVALGKGAWAQLPPPVQQTFIENAPTFADECHDLDQLIMDVSLLRSFTKPVLATKGDQSPQFFAPVLTEVVANLPHAETIVHEGAGHMPHTTHPNEYVETVTSFIRKNEEA